VHKRRVDEFLREQIVTIRDHDVVSRSIARALWVLFVLVIAPAARAQSGTSSEPPDQTIQAPPSSPPAGRLTFGAPGSELSGRWIPLGPAPVDQAGAGRRGYVLPGEDGLVTGPGSNQVSIHSVAANNFYREENTEFLITQRYETHTIAIDYRRGFKMGELPRFELGGQMQLHESDGGILNGFILGLENLWVSMTGYEQSRNQLRGQGATAPPPGTRIVRHGSPIYRDAGNGSGIGDLYGVAKIALVDGDPSSNAPRVSARIGLNVAGRSAFSEGNFVGAGMSLDHKLLERMAFHADIRATRALDQMSVWNLPLRRWTYGVSAGPEFRLGRNTSFNLQLDGTSTPYLPTGTLAFDKSYGALTFGLGHRFVHATTQLYVRENMNLPFVVRWNTDPDMSIGLKIRIH
jgi:hypothetical protein